MRQVVHGAICHDELSMGRIVHGTNFPIGKVVPGAGYLWDELFPRQVVMGQFCHAWGEMSWSNLSCSRRYVIVQVMRDSFIYRHFVFEKYKTYILYCTYVLNKNIADKSRKDGRICCFWLVTFFLYSGH
jgi:hypothetical protein